MRTELTEDLREERHIKMTNYTRIAATLGLASSPNGAFRQNFFLNGRRSYRPQTGGFVEITADRASFGAVFALYQSAGSGAHDDSADKEIAERLERLRVQMDTPGRHRIDNSINNLADVSVQACGSGDISDEDAWFTGVMVRDRELVTVSQGPVVAYLYRDDALIPLTADELEWPAKDAFGNSIKDYDIYQAGQAGQVRYSNIAALRPNDCILLAPHHIMAALGQREVLRLLDEAEDQEEAALLLIERMDDHASGHPLSLMIMFVESIYEARPDRRGRLPRRAELERSLFSREAEGSAKLSERRSAQADDSEEPSVKRFFEQADRPVNEADELTKEPDPGSETVNTEAEPYRRPQPPEEYTAAQFPSEPERSPAEPRRLDQAHERQSVNNAGIISEAESERESVLTEEDPVPFHESYEGEADSAVLPAAYDEESADSPESENDPAHEEPVNKLQLSYLWPFIMVGVLVVVIALLIWQLLMKLNIFNTPELTVNPGLEAVLRPLHRYL